MHYILVGNGKMARTYYEHTNSTGDICDGVFDEINISKLEHAEKTQVLIDFSSPDALAHIVKYLQKHPTPFISGTTGLVSEQVCEIKKLASEMPIILCANFSLGLAVLKRTVKNIAMLSENCGFDAVLSEVHHKTKKDSPSGTALQLTKIAKIPKENIVSHRVSDVIGRHILSYYGPGEELHFAHVAQSRRVFAAGAHMAAEKLIHLPPGFYRFEDLLEETNL